MNAEIHTLTGAYAMDALSEDERVTFEHHMAECPSCTAEVAELQDTAARLGLAVATTPPSSMKSEVLAAARRVRQLPPGGEPGLPSFTPTGPTGPGPFSPGPYGADPYGADSSGADSSGSDRSGAGQPGQFGPRPSGAGQAGSFGAGPSGAGQAGQTGAGRSGPGQFGAEPSGAGPPGSSGDGLSGRPGQFSVGLSGSTGTGPADAGLAGGSGMAGSAGGRSGPADGPFAASPDSAGSAGGFAGSPGDELAARRARRWPTWTAGLAAAACLVVAVVFGAQAFSAQRETRQAQEQLDLMLSVLAAPDARIATASAGDSRATAVVSQSQGKVAFMARGMPPLPDDRSYQVWSIGPTGMHSIGVMGTGADPAPVLGSLADGDSIGVTVEPRGGSATPSTDPIMEFDLPT